MFKQILKLIGRTVKKTTETVGKSMDFIDDTLEDEPIAKAAKRTKDVAGKVIMKAGEGYQKTMDKIEEFSESEKGTVIMDNVKKVSEFVTDKTVEIVESSKDMINKNEPFKSAVDKLSKAGKVIIDKADEQIDKLNDQLEDAVFGEEE